MLPLTCCAAAVRGADSHLVAVARAAQPTGSAAHGVPSYPALAAGPWQQRRLQGRAFRFTLGGGEDDPALVRTRDTDSLADPEPTSCYIGEWGYSFHHLKNGALDGAGRRHWGGFPTPPKTRAEAMEVVRRYYVGLHDDVLRTAAAAQRKCFISINGHYCYQHYACEWGCDVVGSEVGENINSIQEHIAFTRGAARQFGKPWLIDFSSWYGPGIFDEDPRRTWGDYSGPTNGHSISLHTRAYYVAWMAGANVVIAEGGSGNAFRSRQPGADGTLPLSTLGQAMAQFHRFALRHPDRGIPYAPIALLLPVDHGVYPGFGPKLAWNAFPYTRGDQQILDALNDLYPGSLGDPDQPERADRQPDDPAWRDPDYMHTEALRLVASPLGDIADALLADASPEVLSAYPVLVAAGDYAPDPALAARLLRCVEQGGTLIVSADAAAALLPHAAETALRPADGKPWSTVRRGRGRIVALAPDGTATPTAKRSLSRLLAALMPGLIPFHIDGRVETLYNRTPDGWIVTLVNNAGVTKTFHEAARVDAAATRTVSIGYRGRGRLRGVSLWGEDGDKALRAGAVTVTVPPGEARIVQFRIDERRTTDGRREHTPVP